MSFGNANLAKKKYTTIFCNRYAEDKGRWVQRTADIDQSRMFADNSLLPKVSRSAIIIRHDG